MYFDHISVFIINTCQGFLYNCVLHLCLKRINGNGSKKMWFIIVYTDKIAVGLTQYDFIAIE